MSKVKKEKKFYSGVGGEAVIEGIMMRGPKGAALSVRMPDGTISTEEKPVKQLGDKYKILKKPFIRGPIVYVESMIFAYKCMMDAATKAGIDDDIPEEEMSKLDKWLSDHFGPKMMAVLGTIAAVIGFALAFGIFFVLPSKSFDLLNDHVANGALDRWRPVIEGVMRMAIFVVYIAAVSLMKDIKRVFMYHGAEHKCIFCIENGLELTVENVRKQIRFHPRCGTSFIFVMIIISVLISAAVNTAFPHISDITALWILMKILLLPVIMSIGYEFIRFAGKHDNLFTKILSAPGLWMQRLSTKEPTDDIIEVGIAALSAVLYGFPEQAAPAEEQQTSAQAEESNSSQPAADGESI